jgi:hypothetical protein
MLNMPAPYLCGELRPSFSYEEAGCPLGVPHI